MNNELVKFDERKKLKYLKLLEETGLKGRSAEAVDIHPSTIRYHREKCEGFDEACNEALRHYAEDLEQELHDRIFTGVPRPIFQKGELVGTEYQKSDRLLELALRANKPEKYRDKVDHKHEVHGGVLVVGKAPSTIEEYEEMYGTKTIEGDLDSASGEPTEVP
jgi:hypothetical protein